MDIESRRLSSAISARATKRQPVLDLNGRDLHHAPSTGMSPEILFPPNGRAGPMFDSRRKHVMVGGRTRTRTSLTPFQPHLSFHRHPTHLLACSVSAQAPSPTIQVRQRRPTHQAGSILSTSSPVGYWSKCSICSSSPFTRFYHIRTNLPFYTTCT